MILLTLCVSTEIAANESVGESIGRKARTVTSGVETAYQSTENFVLDTTYTVENQVQKIEHSLYSAVNEVENSFNEFIWDVERGYAENSPD